MALAFSPTLAPLRLVSCKLRVIGVGYILAFAHRRAFTECNPGLLLECNFLPRFAFVAQELVCLPSSLAVDKLGMLLKEFFATIGA